MEQSDIPVFYRDVALLHLQFAILLIYLDITDSFHIWEVEQ